MGHTYAKVIIRNPRNTVEKLELELVVDIGSTYTWTRRGKLENLELNLLVGGGLKR